jgi:processive 1,2-diacylglycerol beta-glucosyltransferase
MRCAPAYGPANGDGRTEGAPRILILSAAVGTGHLRAAEAVQLALQSIQPQARVCNLDILALSIYPFRRCYGGMYLDFVNHAPLILSCAYSLMDRPGWCSAPSRWDRVRVFLEKLGLGRLLAVLREPWDLVINTHFLGGEIVADLRRKEKFFAPQVTVTTDFETNRAWITEPCDHYYTATEEAALYLQKQGVPPGHTSVVGIPVHPVFSEDKDRDTCLARCGLRGGRPVVLQLAGGHGVGRLEEVYRALLEVREPLELVVVTGKNPAARTHLERLELPTRHRVRVLGYTDRIDEFMRAADVVVSKPGGLTSSEALACGTPLVLVDPVPGQEERNSDFLLEQGAAVKANHLPTLAHKVGELLGDPGRMARLKANARRIGRPRAAYDIVARSLDLIGQPVPTGN